jgi:hypothetical protein
MQSIAHLLLGVAAWAIVDPNRLLVAKPVETEGLSAALSA